MVDSRGETHFISRSAPADITSRAATHLPSLPASGIGMDIPWDGAGAGANWSAAMARINSTSTASELALAVVALERDQPWSAALLAALRAQLLPLLLLALLAAWCARHVFLRLAQPLQQLRRALVQLPDRRLLVPLQPRQPGEVRQLLEAYFGPGVVLDQELDLECLRIPHFYSAFYVYKYATGVSAAIALAERVLNGSASAVEAYLGFLKSGGSQFPLETLLTAGVDMTSSAPVESTLRLFEKRLTELEELLRA